MLRNEFDTLLKEFNDKENGGCFPAPTDDEYRLIEFVYNYHPCNFDKSAVTKLYADFGMTLFYDMERRAKDAMELEDSIERTNRLIRQYQDTVKRMENDLKVLGDVRYSDD